MTTLAIEVKNLIKTYNGVTVVKGINLSVKKGSVFGFLGPNGAGKTTTLEMIEGLRKPNEGEILINGLNTATDMHKVKAMIGVQLQSSILDDRIKVEEAIQLFASFYEKSLPIEYLLELTDLKEKRHSLQKKLSGGQKQRLALALCLVNDPEILFLDEPTTGLDPQSRRNLWDIITMMKEKGKTIVLTTHYMDEAEKLCDQIAIIDQGNIIDSGSPKELISRLESSRVIEIPIGEEFIKILEPIKSKNKLEYHAGIAEIHTNQIANCIEEILQIKSGVDIDNLHIRKATLEDVFIQLTGRSLKE